MDSNNSIRKDMRSFGFNGKVALEHLFATSEYRSIGQAVSALTLFSHPQTVAQTKALNVFQIIRAKNMSDRGLIIQGESGRVMHDDNTSPTDLFLWANGIRRSEYCDVQFNHIWADSDEVTLYTSLANICLTPAFLAKLTDTDVMVRGLLRRRAYDLYNGFKPENMDIPIKLPGYDDLKWAAPMPPVADLERQLRLAMSTKTKSRAAISALEIGWFFSEYKPDPAISSNYRLASLLPSNRVGQ